MSTQPRRQQSRADRRRRDLGPPGGQERRSTDVPPVVINWDTEPAGIVISLENPLVVSNCFAVRDRLEKYASKFTARHIAVDLTGVPYADSTGIGMLAEIHGVCTRMGKKFVVRHPTPHVRRTLEILDLDQRLLEEDE